MLDARAAAVPERRRAARREDRGARAAGRGAATTTRSAAITAAGGEPGARGRRGAPATCCRGIERARALWEVGQNVWYGLSLGSVLLLAAIGLAITFGVMGVINMAHGELVMLGAYTTFVVQEALRAHAPWAMGWSLAMAVPLAFLVAGAVGVAIERGICRHPLRPAAGDAAGDLGRQPDPAAGGAHDLRSDEPAGRRARTGCRARSSSAS